ncbi:MAG TPA: hypothetical protein VFD38_02875, partial [Myxococcaceae bacterium]|nr:hypothetical protein [Myxococcaceae bacterium]
VLDSFGQPVASRTVVIGAASTTTDGLGAFTLTGVTTPYDLIILEPAPAKVATVYSQLSRTNPRLLDLPASPPPARSASLGGLIVGGDPLPTPSGTFTAIGFGAPQTASTAIDVTASPYAFGVAWYGPTTITGAVHGLQWTVDTNGTVTGYRSHGVSTGVSLTSGGTVTNADVQLTAVLPDSVSTLITAPAGHEIVQRDVFLTFDDGAYFPVSRDFLDGGTFTVPVPAGVGARADVTITAATSDQSSFTLAQLFSLPPGTSGAPLTLPSPAVATAPANGATGVDTNTDLVWTPVPSGVHILFLSGAANDPAFLIFSSGSHVRIPDLSGRGLGLPSGHPYDFGLVAIGPYASLDAFVETGFIPPQGPGFQTGTATGFTTR